MAPALSYNQLHALCAELGLNLVGVGDVHNHPASGRWRTPSELFPELKSIVAFAVPYDHSPAPPLKEGFGRIARFAWGRDYHIVIKELLTTLVFKVSQSTGYTPKFRAGVDSIPLLERDTARLAGLGFIGKNSLILRKGVGSFFFLAEILWDVEIAGVPHVEISGSCGECRICEKACPVSVIKGDGKIDSSRCISYLTIEKRGAFSAEERDFIGENVFGCDICQECCPVNEDDGAGTVLPAFKPDGTGPGPLLSIETTLAIRDNTAFKKRFSGTSLLRAKREGLLRNCAAVAANTHAVSVEGALETAFVEDSSAIVREASLSALCRLHRECGSPHGEKIRHLLDLAVKDSLIEPDCALP